MRRLGARQGESTHAVVLVAFSQNPSFPPRHQERLLVWAHSSIFMYPLKHARDWLTSEIACFKRLGWKDRLWLAGINLAFGAGLLAGIWQIGQGFHDGPNFAATRVVVVDDLAAWRAQGQSGDGVAYWTVGYHFTSGKGETLSRRISVSPDDPAASRVRTAKAGDEILMRVGVPREERGAVFGINKTVRRGLAILLALPFFWHFIRGDFLTVDAVSGAVVPAKTRFITLLLAFFATLLGLLWLISPVIP